MAKVNGGRGPMSVNLDKAQNSKATTKRILSYLKEHKKTLILVLLFIDASYRLYQCNETKEMKEANGEQKNMFDFAKLFTSQRNFYLTGSNLIFLLVIWRVRHLLKETFE